MPDSTQNQSNSELTKGDDQLRSLHKMSTTAGIGSGDYVAINGVAVWAIVLGLASSLAILDAVLLVIPITAIILALIAWRQVGDSNGTQSGRGLALGGLLLALIFAGFRGTLQWRDYAVTQSDRAEMSRMLTEFGNDVKTGDFTAAYALFSPQFHDAFPLDRFATTLKFVQKTEIYGNLVSVSSNGYYQFEVSPADPDQKRAVTTALIAFDKAGEPLHQDAIFRHQNGKWYIDNIPRFFPQDDTKKKKE